MNDQEWIRKREEQVDRMDWIIKLILPLVLIALGAVNLYFNVVFLKQTTFEDKAVYLTAVLVGALFGVTGWILYHRRRQSEASVVFGVVLIVLGVLFASLFLRNIAPILTVAAAVLLELFSDRHFRAEDEARYRDLTYEEKCARVPFRSCILFVCAVFVLFLDVLWLVAAWSVVGPIGIAVTLLQALVALVYLGYIVCVLYAEYRVRQQKKSDN